MSDLSYEQYGDTETLAVPTRADFAQDTTPEAIQEAHEINRARLARRIAGIAAGTSHKADRALYYFVRNNQEAGQELHAGFKKGFAAINKGFRSDDDAQLAQARSDLREAALFIAKNTRSDVRSLDRRGLGLVFLTTGDRIQKKMNHRAYLNALADINDVMAGQNMRNLGMGVFNAGKAALYDAPKAVLMGGASGIAMLTHLYVGFTRRRGWNALQRIGLLGAAVSSLGFAHLTSAAPEHFQPHATQTSEATAEMIVVKDPQSCEPDKMFTDGLLTAAFAFGMEPQDLSVSKSLHYTSAMQGVHYDVSPVALYIISMQETNGGRDVSANNSSAEGAYQALPGTQLEQVARFGQDTPLYKATKEQLAANAAYAMREQDQAFIDAIDEVSRDFRANQRGVMDKIKNNELSFALQTALNAARTPVFGGQLMAADIAVRAPYLSTSALEGKTPAEISQAVARYYRSDHLLGAEGGAFFNHMVRTSPDTTVGNSAALRRHYAAFRPSAAQSRINYMSGFYREAAGSNPGVFRSGNTTSFRQAHARLDHLIQLRASPVLAEVTKGQQIVQERIAQCQAEVAATQPTTVTGKLASTFNLGQHRTHNKLTNLDVYKRETRELYAKVPEGWRNRIESAPGIIMAGVMSLAAKFGHVQDTPAPTTPVRSDDPIADIIVQSEQEAAAPAAAQRSQPMNIIWR